MLTLEAVVRSSWLLLKRDCPFDVDDDLGMNVEVRQRKCSPWSEVLRTVLRAEISVPNEFHDFLALLDDW